VTSPATNEAAVESASLGAPRRSYRTQVLSGFAWNIASSAGTQVFRLALAILLARLLTPSDYGLAAMTLVFSSLVLSFSDLSLGAGLVQRREITEADRSTVFWTSVGMGVVLMLAGFALAKPLSWFYGNPQVAPLFVVVSTSFLLVSLQTTQASLLQREMRFREINVRIVAGVVVGGTVGLVAALLGAGAWALILQQVAASATSTLLLWVFSSWRPKLVFSRESLRRLSSFGLNLLGARLLVYLNRNVDNILVGRFLGAAALGAYSISYNLMYLPLDRLILPIQEAIFPAYSRWQDDHDRIVDVWLRLNRIVTAIVAPAMVGLVVVAPDFIDVILGRRWHAGVPVVQVLAAVAVVQSIAGLGERVLTALGRTRTIFRYTIVDCALTVPAFALGLHWGIVGVAVCYASVTIPMNVAFAVMTSRAIRISPRRVLGSVTPVLLATAAMAAACVAVRSYLVAERVPAGARLLAVIVFGAAIYVPLCAVLEPRLRAELQRVRRSRAAGLALD
jgi:O-antigen/teichoic acid export membrane protein